MMQEEEIIQLFFPSGEAPGDDCAHLSESGLTITGDTMAEGTHFRRQWHPPDKLGRKLLQSNLSDLAAGGANPLWCLLQLGLPTDLDGAYLREFARAFREECRSEGCRLIGGDTFRSETLILSLTLAGQGPRPPGRHAVPGDSLYVTGNVGLSLAGLQHLQGQRILPPEIREQALEKHLAPRARLAWSRHLHQLPGLHGIMDVSDGLIQDADRFARAASATFRIRLEDVPVAPGLEMGVEEAAASGEEYELFFAAAPGLTFPFPVTEIGVVEEKGASPVHFTMEGKTVQVPGPGFRHFA